MEMHRSRSFTIRRIQPPHLFLVFYFLLLTCVSNSNTQQQQYVSSNDNCFTAVRDAQGGVTLEKCQYNQYPADVINFQLNKALASAWEDYGPNSKYHVTRNIPSKSSLQYGNGISSRDTLSTYGNEGQYLGYAPGSPGLPARVNFQPTTSEWDADVRPFPLRTRNPALEPSLFSHFLQRYVAFEVNHHEVADYMRLAGFGFLVGIIILGWVILGFFVGFLPITFLLTKGRSDEAGKDIPGLSVMNERNNNDILRSITERVLLALDGEWLRKLEEKVKLGNENGKWLKTHVHCCILPDDKAQGVADCELVRKARKVSTFKCLSDLIYNFQFGPNNNLTLEETEISDSSADSTSEVDNKKKELEPKF